MVICTGVWTKKVIELENHFIFRLFLNLEMSKCELKSAFIFMDGKFRPCLYATLQMSLQLLNEFIKNSVQFIIGTLT